MALLKKIYKQIILHRHFLLKIRTGHCLVSYSNHKSLRSLHLALIVCYTFPQIAHALAGRFTFERIHYTKEQIFFTKERINITQKSGSFYHLKERFSQVMTRQVLTPRGYDGGQPSEPSNNLTAVA